MAQFSNGFFGRDMDDMLAAMMQQMGEHRVARYVVNGHELTADQFAQYRATGQLPEVNETTIPIDGQSEAVVKKGGILDKLGRNLTAEAAAGRLDPVIGRDKEIQETAEILSRRTKNNPILVGDAGVGKTAIVEGLAQAIVAGNVPEALSGHQIYAIDLANLEAGTQYRGSFEQNIQDLVKEVKAAGNIILFFDEIHQILGTGATGGEDGGKGLADIIKPALSRGELTVIGATTQDEYRNTVMKDAALARRFNDVTVNAPSADATFQILQGIRKLYEQHHHVTLPDSVLHAAVEMSERYIPQRSLPDKAIDLIDMTAAHLAAKHPVTDRATLERRQHELTAQKDEAAQAEDYERAAQLKTELAAVEDQLQQQQGKQTTVTATPEDVAQSVERLTGIPVSQLGATDIEHLKRIGDRLRGKVIGQDEAVEMVARAIRRNRAGFDEGNRPIGSFLFVGPTGVGKTELAKQLAKDLFGSKEAIIRLDMSEYSDQTAVSKLIGTTAGYVGYDDNGNTLTEQVRRQPYAIVLLDEIEKADPQVLTLLLQVLDDGRLTDGQGNVVNFKNTVVIATSNAGYGHNSVDEDTDLMTRLAPYFRPEFLNRFNGIVAFRALSKDDLRQIVSLMLEDVDRTLAKKGITLAVGDDVKQWLSDQGYDDALGARPLRRVIEREIRDRVTDYYLDHPEVKALQAVLDDDHIVIEAA